MHTELNSLIKREVFGPVAQTPRGINIVGYKWVFVQRAMKIMRSSDIKHD